MKNRKSFGGDFQKRELFGGHFRKRMGCFRKALGLNSGCHNAESAVLTKMWYRPISTAVLLS